MGVVPLTLRNVSAKVVRHCKFCSVAHQAMSLRFGSNPQSIEALRTGDEIEDQQDRVLAQTAVAVVESKGWIAEDKLEAFFDAGFTSNNIWHCSWQEQYRPCQTTPTTLPNQKRILNQQPPAKPGV